MEKFIEIILKSYSDYAGYLYHEITNPSWGNYFYWLIGISLFFFTLEWLRPWRKSQSVLKRDFWLDVFYMFFNFFLFSLIGYYAISNVFVEAFNGFLASVFGIKNLIAIQVGALPVVAQLAILFVLRDFIHWNVHRLLHRVPFLWEFHKVHHSAKELGFATHLRFHWMETVVYRMIEYIPLGMIGFGIQDFFFVHIIAISIGHFNHSNIRVPLGFFKYIFNNPQMHKWHHAKNFPASHPYGINFGISLSVWDYLFKTAHVPYDAASLELGYPGDEEMPENFAGQSIFPLSKKRRRRKTISAKEKNPDGPRWIFLLLLLTLSGQAGAQGILHVDDAVDERNFMPYELTYFIDTTSTLAFDEISSPAFAARFRQNRNYQNKDFKINASYWIRLPIRHTVNTEKHWLLEFYDQTIDYLDAYVPQPDGSYKKVSMGDRQPFIHRTLLHKNFEIPLDMKSDTLMVYYFRVQSHGFADVRIAFRSVNRFVYYALNEYFLFGTFYGMILIISLYNFLVFLAIKEIKNIYYILYILSVAAYAMSYDGIGFQYLWPQHPEWNDYATGATLYSVILWALVFTRRFLRTQATAPSLDRMLKWLIVLRSAFFVAEITFLPELLTYRNVEIIPLSLIFITAIMVWNRGYRPARFFVMAYGFLFGGFFIRSLVYFNVLPFTTPLHYSLHFSFVLEMLFLTFAMGDRIRILKAMRDRALKRIIHQHEINMQLKDKVNRELEQKVLERTLELNRKNEELEKTNEKLERQSTEINQINSMLDLDNWKLKNSIKEVLNERLMDKTMDYQQFRTLYTDKLSCYRFLETLKWEKAFHCRKCGNEKYFDGLQKFSRRCTRCGYNESITTFTIFHGIKFPIEKAFYIAYLAVTGKKDHTLESLSQELNLRMNTVWGFKRKVLHRISGLEKHGKKPTASKWEEVIMVPQVPKGIRDNGMMVSSRP